MSKLYNWRYQALGDLPSVSHQERFRKANAGLAYDYQFIGEHQASCSSLLLSPHRPPCFQLTGHPAFYAQATLLCCASVAVIA